MSSYAFDKPFHVNCGPTLIACVKTLPDGIAYISDIYKSYMVIEYCVTFRYSDKEVNQKRKA
jgi:hypothetical protein